MALDIVMLGAPGAGKGTQATRLACRYRIPAISTGDMLREAVQAGSDLGLRVKAVMDRGELVGDDLMIDIVRDRLARPDTVNGFVLDGFPRTRAQAEALDAMMDGDGLIVINVEVPAEEIVRRLSARRVCSSCGAIAAPSENRPAAAGQPETRACARCGGRLVERSDDREDVVRERLKVYERNTRPLLDYYRSRRAFRTIDGLQRPEAVTGAITDAIETIAAGQGSEVRSPRSEVASDDIGQRTSDTGRDPGTRS